MSVVASDPLSVLRAEIEAEAQRDDLTPDARIGALRLWRDDLTALVGRVETYMGDLELEREALDPAFREAVMGLYEDADLRETLIRRGMFTADEMDAMGYLTRDDIKRLAEESLLEAWVEDNTKIEEWLGISFDELKHPRGRGGKFRDVLGRVVAPKGRHGRAVPMPKGQAAARGAERVAKAKPAVEKPKAKPAAPTKPDKPEASTPPEAQDPGAEKIAADLQWARDNGVNGWPKKGETAQSILGESADTQELHTVSVRAAGGTRVYTPEREKFHDQIVDLLLRKRQEVTKPDGTIEAHPDPKGVPLKAPMGKPRVLFMGGGTASGKSTALGLDENADVIPKDAVHIDPDEIKAMLPEYREMVKRGDKYAAMAAHEESSDIAKRLHREAVERGLNMVVDGTGDSAPGKFAGKIRDAAAAGYDVHAFYVNAATDIAVVRSVKRAQRTGRWVPEPEVRKIHASVSGTFARDIQPLVEDGTISNLRMYDTGGDEPVLMATGAGGLHIHDADVFGRFLAKADEANY